MADSQRHAPFKVEGQDSVFPFLPRLRSPDYYARPSVREIAFRESSDEGFCSRVPDFVVGRAGYGQVKFFGTTDVRWLDLEKIVKFCSNSIAVYEDEREKPPVGHGLNKAAEVSLIIDSKGADIDSLVRKLKRVSEEQGARFLSFDSTNSEWKFLVPHFSRFGLVDDDDDDAEEEDEDDALMDEKMENPPEALSLSHSLPAHLGLDPVKMQEMRMLLFSGDDERMNIEASTPIDHYLYPDSPGSHARPSIHRSSPHGSSQKTSSRITPMKKAPVALLEYDLNSSELQFSGNILLNRQTKGFPVKTMKSEGFKLDTKKETLLNGSYSSNIVDASLLMGRSFRVGWGPNGTLVHCGTPVGKPGNGLSSVIHVEKVALDSVARDEKGKLKEDLIDLCFISPLKLHMSLNHEFKYVGSESSRFRIQKVVADRLTLEEISRGFIEILERHLEVPNLSESSRIIFVHQVTVWELMRVLFSDKAVNGQLPLTDPEDDDMALDKKDIPSDVDQVASHLIRRANFSHWLQESVRHRIQEEVSLLSGPHNLTHLLLLLTCRQLDAAVELAASSGDVRLAILLSQAGGSMVNRSDIARQLDLWRINGLDFSFVEKERLKLYELLSGNVQVAFHESKIDWKRYLGSIMWYHLPPDTPLPFIIQHFEQLVNDGKAPLPVPVYIDEGPLEESVSWNVGDRCDITYYLMLLHATEEGRFGDIKTMFSAFSSSSDPLDYHMIWQYKAILEAIGTFTSDDLHLLDLSFASQLLSLGLCHWAIYVVLHMPYNEDFHHVQTNFIKEILFRNCETWNTKEVHKQFIMDLGIPSSWMDEALAVYYEYHGDLPAALDHYLGCHNWQKSHTIFVTSVGHSLFLSGNHSEIWRLAGVMEVHKAEIPDWDLGGGIYIDFYTTKSLLQEKTIDEQETLEKKEHACRSFFNRLKESLKVWGDRIPVDARAVYSKMAEELCTLLVTVPAEDSSPSVQMSCFETMLSAPTPEDVRSRHLQDALSVFTLILSEMAA